MRLGREFRRSSYIEKSAFTNPHYGLRNGPFLKRSYFFSTRKTSNISASNRLDVSKRFTLDGVNYFQAFSDFSPVGTVIDLALRKQNTDAFVAAFNSSYTEIYIPKGRYVFDTFIFIAWDRIQGQATKNIYGEIDTNPLNNPKDPKNNTIFDTTFFDPQYNSTRRDYDQPIFFNIYGPPPRAIETTNSIIQKGTETTYKFSPQTTPNFKIGDLFVITDPQNYSYGQRDYYRKGEIIEIKAVDASTNIVTFDCIDSYRSGCNLFKLDTLSVNLKNIHITAKKNNNDPIDPKAVTTLALSRGRNCTFENVTIDESSYYIGLDLHSCYDCNISLGRFNVNKVIILDKTPAPTESNRHPEKILELQNAYGLSFTHCQKINVNSISAESHWHAIASGGGEANVAMVNRIIKINDSTFTRRIIPDIRWAWAGSAANFHGNTELSGFTGCTLYNSGFNIGGHNNYYTNNKIYPNSRDPNKLLPQDSGFQFNENLSLSFTITGNYVKITGFRKEKIVHNENFYSEFLYLPIIDHSNGLWPLPDNCKLTISWNTFELDCSKDLPTEIYSNSRVIFIGSVSVTPAYQSIFPQMSIDISDNRFTITNKPENVSMSIDICGENGEMNPIENERRREENQKDPKYPKKPGFWAPVRDITISNNSFTFISLFVNNMPLLNPVDSKSDQVVIENNDLSTKGSEGENQLVKISQAKSVTLKYNRLMGVPDQTNLKFKNFTDIDPPLSPNDYVTNTYNGHT